MLSKMSNYLETSFSSASKSGQISFEDALLFVNIRRMRIIASFAIFMTALLIIVDYALLGTFDKAVALAFRPYLISFRLITIFASSAFLVTVKNPKHAHEIPHSYRRLTYGYIFFMLIYISILTCMVQVVRDEITVYLLGIFLAASSVYLNRRQVSIFFGTSLIILFTGSWFTQTDKSAFMFNTVNSIIMTSFAWITSQIIYASQKRDYLNQQLIEQQRAQLSESNEQLERLSYIDPLTNLPNRRYFDEYLDTEWSKAQEECTPISLILVDIDNFKDLNDTFGHQAGDSYLKQVGLVLSTSINDPNMLVARLGGDEYAIVIPGADSTSARLTSERLLNDVRALNRYDNQVIGEPVTISLGVSSTTPRRDEFVVEFFAEADQALYKAKKRGRNQVALESAM